MGIGIVTFCLLSCALGLITAIDLKGVKTQVIRVIPNEGPYIETKLSDQDVANLLAPAPSANEIKQTFNNQMPKFQEHSVKETSTPNNEFSEISIQTTKTENDKNSTTKQISEHSSTKIPVTPTTENSSSLESEEDPPNEASRYSVVLHKIFKMFDPNFNKPKFRANQAEQKTSTKPWTPSLDCSTEDANKSPKYLDKNIGGEPKSIDSKISQVETTTKLWTPSLDRSTEDPTNKIPKYLDKIAKAVHKVLEPKAAQPETTTQLWTPSLDEKTEDPAKKIPKYLDENAQEIPKPLNPKAIQPETTKLWTPTLDEITDSANKIPKHLSRKLQSFDAQDELQEPIIPILDAQKEPSTLWTPSPDEITEEPANKIPKYLAKNANDLLESSNEEYMQIQPKIAQPEPSSKVWTPSLDKSTEDPANKIPKYLAKNANDLLESSNEEYMQIQPKIAQPESSSKVWTPSLDKSTEDPANKIPKYLAKNANDLLESSNEEYMQIQPKIAQPEPSSKMWTPSPDKSTEDPENKIPKYLVKNANGLLEPSDEVYKPIQPKIAHLKHPEQWIPRPAESENKIPKYLVKNANDLLESSNEAYKPLQPKIADPESSSKLWTPSPDESIEDPANKIRKYLLKHPLLESNGAYKPLQPKLADQDVSSKIWTPSHDEVEDPANKIPKYLVKSVVDIPEHFDQAYEPLQPKIAQPEASSKLVTPSRETEDPGNKIPKYLRSLKQALNDIDEELEPEVRGQKPSRLWNPSIDDDSEVPKYLSRKLQALDETYDEQVIINGAKAVNEHQIYKRSVEMPQGEPKIAQSETTKIPQSGETKTVETTTKLWTPSLDKATNKTKSPVQNSTPNSVTENPNKTKENPKSLPGNITKPVKLPGSPKIPIILSPKVPNTKASFKPTFNYNLPFLDPKFWENLAALISGNIKVGLHGDMSNVASGNVETKGSFGINVNGYDVSVGGKLGASGSLGQGLTNTGSVGAGGKLKFKPSWTYVKSNNQGTSSSSSSGGSSYSSSSSGSSNGSSGTLSNLFQGLLKPMRIKGNSQNWEKIQPVFKLFVNKGNNNN